MKNPRAIKTATEYPTAPESEKSILHCLLEQPKYVLEVLQSKDVTREWFSNYYYQIFFDIISTLAKENDELDFIFVSEWVRVHAKDYPPDFMDRLCITITDIQTVFVTVGLIGQYIDTLKLRFVQKKAMLACKENFTLVNETTTVQEVFDLTTKAFTEVRELCADKDGKDWHGDACLEFVDEVDRAMKGGNNIRFFPTTLTVLDKEVMGIRPGEMLTITGVDGSGKSLLGNQIIKASVLEKDESADIYTMEMPQVQCIRRLVSAYGEISLKSLNNGRMDKGEMMKFMPAVERVRKANLRIFDRKRLSMTPEAIEASIRHSKRNFGLSIVMIDYLQLIKIKHKKEVRHDQALGFISSMLKGLAVELDISVILIASENKEGTVRDTGNLDYDTDCLLRMVCDKEKILEKVLVSKWREGQRGYYIPSMIQGEFCRITEKTDG